MENTPDFKYDVFISYSRASTTEAIELINSAPVVIMSGVKKDDMHELNLYLQHIDFIQITPHDNQIDDLSNYCVLLIEKVADDDKGLLEIDSKLTQVLQEITSYDWLTIERILLHKGVIKSFISKEQAIDIEQKLYNAVKGIGLCVIPMIPRYRFKNNK